MAKTVLTVHKLDDKNVFSADIATLATAMTADGAEFVMDDRDDKYLILLHNKATSAQAVTIKHGNGIQGVCDLTGSVGASAYQFVSLDSGRFKNVFGDDKGKVIFAGNTNIEVAVFKLP